MPPTRRNVRRVLRWLGYVVLALVLLPIVVIYVLPDWLGFRILILIVIAVDKFGKWISYGVLALLCAAFYQWVFKQRIKNRGLALVASMAATYAGICLFSFLHQSSYERCDYYTKELNGGVRTFKGKQYTMQLCGTEQLWGGGDEVRLQVLGEQGDLLARRYFVFYWNDSGERSLHFSDDVIFYYDNSKHSPLSTINMPPATIDWLTARLPLFN